MKRLLLFLLLAGCSSVDSPLQPATAQSSNAAVRLGALIKNDPLGDPDTQAAIQLGQEDINKEFAPLHVQVIGTDYDAARALAGLQQLEAQGITIVVGPETSGELEALKPHVDRTRTVLISHCSTAGSLAVAGDTIYRLVPSDVSQSRVIANRIKASGVTSVVQVFRDDVFGRDVSSGVASQLQAQGVTVAARIAYPPDATNFAAVIDDLAARVAPGVAVQLSAFGPDAALLLQEASTRPALGALRWFGTDGTAKSREILANPQAAAFAQTVALENPLFAVPVNAKTQRITQRIQTRSGAEVQSCALAAYDAVWIAYQAALSNRNAIPPLADNFFGSTGWTALNAAGDREAAEYDLWVIRQNAWVSAGRV